MSFTMLPACHLQMQLLWYLKGRNALFVPFMSNFFNKSPSQIGNLALAEAPGLYARVGGLSIWHTAKALTCQYGTSSLPIWQVAMLHTKGLEYCI